VNCHFLLDFKITDIKIVNVVNFERNIMKVILASGSPRRKELLTKLGISFDVIISNADETISTTDPKAAVKELSEIKAKAVLNEINKGLHKDILGDEKDYIIIGADTVVAHGNKIIGKPKDKEDAVKILLSLSGDIHSVYTGVTIIRVKDNEISSHTFAESTSVSMYKITREEANEYVNSGEPMDKAGAYAIQGLGMKFIRMIEGDYNNVVGLPAARLYHELKDVLPIE